MWLIFCFFERRESGSGRREERYGEELGCAISASQIDGVDVIEYAIRGGLVRSRDPRR